MEKLLATLATTMILSSCMASHHLITRSAQPTARHVAFTCDKGETITVDFSEGQALLEYGAVSVQLAQQPSGSGIHYAGGGHDLRGKGPDMTWTDAAGTVHQCRDQQAAARRLKTLED